MNLPSKAILGDIEKAANAYWPNENLEASVNIQEGAILLRPAGGGKSGMAAVLSEWKPAVRKNEKDPDKRDRRLIGSPLNEKGRTQEQLGSYHARTYRIGGKGISRGTFLGGTFATGAAAAAAYFGLRWHSSNPTGQAVDPMDADMVFIYGEHVSNVDAFLNAHLVHLEQVIERHRKKVGDTKDLVFVNELMEPLGPYLPMVYKNVPELSGKSVREILEDPKNDEGLRDFYQWMTKAQQDFFVKLFPDDGKPGMQIPAGFQPFLRGLWAYIAKNRIKVIPEPVPFEAWKLVSLTVYGGDQAMRALMERRDVSEYVR